MQKKQHIALLLVSLSILALAACSVLGKVGGETAGGAVSAGAESSSAQGQTQQGQMPELANQPIEQKLAIGTLKLEGSANAVTSEQAAALLPLWKAVKSMSANTNTSAEEMSALYEQIQGTMTAEQVQAIKDLKLTMEDTQALMKEYGIELPQGGGPGNLSKEERATRIAQFQAEGGGQAGGGQVGGGNFPGGSLPGGGGIPEGGAMPGGTTQRDGQRPNFQGTPPAGGRRPGGGFGGGFNTMFIDPLIKLLEERAGS